MLHATDLSNAYLWRTDRASVAIPSFAAVRLSDTPNPWRPLWWDDKFGERPWNGEDYQGLHKTLETLQPGALRDQALERIRSLDCDNPDPRLASCDPSVPLPPDTDVWRKSLEDARADDAGYAKALAAALETLVCSGEDNAAYVLRGPGFQHRIADAGSEGPALVDFIMSKDCPISAALTDDDKAGLLRIKEWAIGATQKSVMRSEAYSP